MCGSFSLIFVWYLWMRLFMCGIIIGFILICFPWFIIQDDDAVNSNRQHCAVGFFNAAISAMLMIVTLGIFHDLMNPSYSKTRKKSINDFKKYFEKYMKFMIFFSYGVTVIFIILAEHYLQIFYNLKDYHESIFCFKILMLSLLFMTINSPLHGGMLAAHKEKTILLITVVQFFFNIIGNLILIPKYGIIGSSIMTVLTEAFDLHYIYYFKKIMPVHITLSLPFFQQSPWGYFYISARCIT